MPVLWGTGSAGNVLVRAWRWLKRTLNRTEWVLRLLGQTRETGASTKPGLLMIQVDGLARGQLERAISKGRMPFLRWLLMRQGHKLHTLYSGLPSTTAAFQGELLYGVPCAVPAYSFFDSKLEKRVHMVDEPAAQGVQKRLAEQGQPLLCGGTSYCGFYDGGADEACFGPSSLGMANVARSMPGAVLWLTLIHSFALVRVAALFVVELFLGVFDAIRAVMSGHKISWELGFIAHRVMLCVVLREVCVIRVKADVTRGVPIVYCDFIGYDEQSHHRGPSSRFAHWTLKGIDDAIKRVWRAAKASSARDYEVWIFSDHGQEHSLPYKEITGRIVQDFLHEIVEDHGGQVTVPNGAGREQDTPWSQSWLGRLFSTRASAVPVGENATWSVCANGPVGHIYAPCPVDDDTRNGIAKALVDRAAVAAALVPDGEGRVRVFKRDGVFVLPDEVAKVVGEDHEFKDSLGEDLVRLVHHADAGLITVLSWAYGAPMVSFAYEHGSHGGIGREETRAFAILPPDAPLPRTGRSYLRALDLHRTARRLLGREPDRDERPPRVRTREGVLRVMTYNVHSCVGTDRKVYPARIARVIARHEPDVVALQEVDVGRRRTGGIDQAQEIARALEMQYHFHPSLQLEEERYGNAVLSSVPMRLVKAGALPGIPDRPDLEPRGVIWVELDVDGIPVQLVNTHLGQMSRERGEQVRAILSEEWLGHPDCQDPVILCGDFNLLPWSRAYRRLNKRVHDAQVRLGRGKPHRTFSSLVPLVRLDHVFIGDDVAVEDVEVPRNQLVMCSSDHLPVIVTLRVKKRG